MGNAGEESVVGWPGLEGWLGAKAGGLGAELPTNWQTGAPMGTQLQMPALVAEVRGMEKAPGCGIVLGGL